MHELANAGIDVLCTNSMGINALHIAAINDYVGIAEMLLGSGFPYKKESNNGMTALMIASLKNHI